MGHAALPEPERSERTNYGKTEGNVGKINHPGIKTERPQLKVGAKGRAMTFFTCVFFKHVAGPLGNSVSFERGASSGVPKLQRNLASDSTRIASY